jgi:hypothetical protein
MQRQRPLDPAIITGLLCIARIKAISDIFSVKSGKAGVNFEGENKKRRRALDDIVSPHGTVYY